MNVIIGQSGPMVELSSRYQLNQSVILPPPTSFFAFTSAWDTATGNDSTAFRDGTRWTSINGGNDNCAIISAAGLGFPATMDNVLHIVTQWNGSGSSSKIPRLTGVLSIPAVGESLYYRWYFRVAVPSGVSTWGTPHPIQDGPDASSYNWELTTRRGTGGTLWSPGFQLSGMAFPFDDYRAIDALSVGVTYRFELQLYRSGTSTYNLHAKVFGADDVTQVLSDVDFKNQSGLGSNSLADTPSITIANLSRFADFQVGTNGAFQGTTSGDHPVTYSYQGGIAIRYDGWCGPYTNNE